MKRWTPDELRLLRAWREAGCTYLVIAQRLGRAEESVGNKGRALRLRVRPTLMRTLLADEIEAAKREAATSPLFRPGDRI